MKVTKTLTVRNLEPVSEELEKLKVRFGCGSASQALIRSAQNFLALERERDQLKVEIRKIKQNHSDLRYKVDTFFEAMDDLRLK